MNFVGKKFEKFDIVLVEYVEMVVVVVNSCDLIVCLVEVKLVNWNLLLFFMILIL